MSEQRVQSQDSAEVQFSPPQGLVLGALACTWFDIHAQKRPLLGEGLFWCDRMDVSRVSESTNKEPTA